MLRKPVSDVKLISSAMPERIKGFGFVSFVSPDSVGIGCASSLRYRGRTLKMRPNPPRAGQRRPIATESHQARMIQVGLRRRDTWVVGLMGAEGGQHSGPAHLLQHSPQVVQCPNVAGLNIYHSLVACRSPLQVSLVSAHRSVDVAHASKAFRAVCR